MQKDIIEKIDAAYLEFRDDLNASLPPRERHLEYLGEFCDHINNMDDLELSDYLDLPDEQFEQIADIRSFIDRGVDRYYADMLQGTLKTLRAAATDNYAKCFNNFMLEGIHE